MPYELAKDKNSIRFFGKKTEDGEDAYIPSQIVGPDGRTPYSEQNRFPTKDADTLAQVQTLNAKIDSLNSKIDAITSGSTPAATKLTGSIVQETKNETHASNGVVTFSKVIKEIGIFNKSDVDGDFNVNGLDIFVPARGSFTKPIGGTPRATVNITGATSYALQRYE